jgi:3-deoxy-D-manno-octulosonic acid kinase
MTLPTEFTLVAAATVRAAIRRDLAPVLAPWLLARDLALPDDAQPITSGRGAVFRATVPGGLRAVVRFYRRGGLLGRVVRETYLGRPPRPLQELALTAEIRRRGVPTAEVLAARVEGRIGYRGVLVTVEVPGAIPLIEALRAAPDEGVRRTLAARAGGAVARLHDAGVWHADLNMNNVLVPAEAPGALVFVDFDRARLSAGPLAAGARRQNLRRLRRSLRKLDPHGAVGGAEEAGAFRQAYGTAAGVSCEC